MKTKYPKKENVLKGLAYIFNIRGLTFVPSDFFLSDPDVENTLVYLQDRTVSNYRKKRTSLLSNSLSFGGRTKVFDDKVFENAFSLTEKDVLIFKLFEDKAFFSLPENQPPYLVYYGDIVSTAKRIDVIEENFDLYINLFPEFKIKQLFLHNGDSSALHNLCENHFVSLLEKMHTTSVYCDIFDEINILYDYVLHGNNTNLKGVL